MKPVYMDPVCWIGTRCITKRRPVALEWAINQSTSRWQECLDLIDKHTSAWAIAAILIVRHGK